MMVPQPPRCNGCSLTQRRFGLFPFRSPLLGESRLISFPTGTEMFQFPAFAPIRLWIQRTVAGFSGSGFPIRTSPSQSLCSGSTELFAATHVLHRFLVPRHPPCALSSLASSSQRRLLSSRCHVTHRPKPMNHMRIREAACFDLARFNYQRTRLDLERLLSQAP